MSGPKTTPEIPTIKSVTVGAIRDMVEQAEELNAAFLQGRTRMDEMADAITRSAAGVVRLGGSLSDVNVTMSQIALGSKRNVIATEEQVSKLFAASQLLGTTTENIVDSFAGVGINASQIGTNLEKSILGTSTLVSYPGWVDPTSSTDDPQPSTSEYPSVGDWV